MITGLETPDTGTVSFFGEAAPGIRSKAWQQRVACVYQRPSVFANLTIAENLFAGRLPTTGARVSWAKMQSEAERILDAWNIRLDPKLLLADAPIEERQMLTIAKALEAGTRIVLLDEPTVQLEGAAIRRLFDKVQELQEAGVTFVFVSHFLREVTAICDSATVLRDGKLLWSRVGDEIRSDDLVDALLAGQEQRRTAPRTPRRRSTRDPPCSCAAPRIARGRSRRQPLGRPGRADRHRRRGGSGKYSVGEAIAGLRPLGGGEIVVAGDPIRRRREGESAGRHRFRPRRPAQGRLRPAAELART